MKIGEKICKPQKDSSSRGGKRPRIKLVKRLDHDLFINKEITDKKDKNEHKKSTNISRKEMEERTELLPNYYEEKYESLKAKSSEIIMDNVDDEEIVVTYSNIRSDHAQDTMEEYYGQRMEERQEMDRLRRYLCDPAVNPNHQGKYGNTALIRAVQTDDKAIVRTLLSCPRVNVNLADYNGYTPLIWAADLGSVTMVKLLLARRDIRVNMRDNNGYTALMWGLENNRVVRRLSRHKDIDVNIQDDDGHTALIWAADTGNVDVVRTLLGVRSIDPNIQSREGFTALICAAGQGFLRVVKYLLEAEETDAAIADNDGYTAMVAAANSGYYHIASTVKQHLYPVYTD